MPHKHLLAVTLFFVISCTTSLRTDTHPALPSSAVPEVLLAEWRNAENRSVCAPAMFAALGDEAAGAVPRRANFSGGWGVAWDQPGRRSAFGIAGTGTTPTRTYEWPHHVAWPGGSAGYGLEGGTGPNWLAYVELEGQQCLYNVWSSYGREHLEELLRNVRLVEER